jgi:secernin
MCDTLCAVGRDRTLFAKSSDRPRDEVQVVEVHPGRVARGPLRTTHMEIDDAGAYALTGSRPTWMWGFEHGINEHRVAIGNERIFTVDDPRQASPALTGMDLVRLGLERGRTADDAISVVTELVERHGQGGRCAEHEDDPYWSSFLVADPVEAWVLETSGRTWAARRTDDGAAISNRVTLRADWSRASSDVTAGTDFDEWRDQAVPTVPADDRLAATGACIATGASLLDPSDVAATMRDHGAGPWGAPGSDPAVWSPPPARLDADLHGFTVCFHVDEPGFLRETTTSSMIAALPRDPTSPLRAWCALGTPCASVYMPVFPVDAVPRALAEPSTWMRFAALRDRIEREPARLAETRAVLGPLETRLWHQADDAAVDERAARARFVEAAWCEVEHALVTLGV